MEVSARPEPVPRAYDCYRKLLADFIEYRRSRNSRLSYRYFAKAAGFSSPNYLQAVIQRKRGLSEGSARSVAKALKMSSGQREYFLALVRVSNAANDRERNQAELARTAALKKMVSKEIPSAQGRVLSSWFHLLIRELVLLEDFEPDPSWMSRKLRGLISVTQAERAFVELVNSGFLIFESGRYRVSDPILDTANNFTHTFLQGFHSQVLQNWSQNINLLSRSEQELGLLNLAIPTRKIPELREKIRQFQDEILGWLEGDKDCDRVAQMGVYLFPF